MINFKKDLYASYVNMDHRVDRNNHMIAELEKAGISAVRQRGMPFHEYTGAREKVWVMEKRTKGAIGCHYSQVAIMEKALQEGKSALVMEDDLVFCSDIQERLSHIEDFLNKQSDWDIFWLGGTVHVNPPQWHTGNNPDLKDSNLGYDAELTSDNRIIRTYGAFCTYAYIVNINSIPKILKMLDDNVHLSMGIDWLFIKLQPLLKTYMYVPGCVKQMDSMSDIGGAVTTFSNFGLNLNGTPEKSVYWYQDKKEDFNPDTFNWGEARTTYESRENEVEKPYVDVFGTGIDNILSQKIDISKFPNYATTTTIPQHNIKDMQYLAFGTPPFKSYYYRCIIEYTEKIGFENNIVDYKIVGIPYFTIAIRSLMEELNSSEVYFYRIKVVHEISELDYKNQEEYSIPLNQYVYYV